VKFDSTNRYLVKNSKLWENLARSVHSDSSPYPFFWGDKDAPFVGGSHREGIFSSGGLMICHRGKIRNFFLHLTFLNFFLLIYIFSLSLSLYIYIYSLSIYIYTYISPILFVVGCNIGWFGV
jgi:hypothetical protein